MGSEDLSPIVIFTYNRPEHIKLLIQSLKENPLSKRSDLIIFSDGNKGEDDRKSVTAVRGILNKVAVSGGFRTIQIYESEYNRGLADSIIYGISAVMAKYDRAIVLEDDLIVSRHFLKYMNDALKFYKDDKHIWSVSGFTRDIDLLHTVNTDMYFSVRAQSWSWGTWRDRWEKIDWNVTDYSVFKYDFNRRKRFNAGGNDMASMLDRQQCGKINSWAIRFCYSQFLHDAYTVQPVSTLVQNAGQDGSGTNCDYVREYSELSDSSEWNFRRREFPLSEMDRMINTVLKSTRKKVPAWKRAGSFIVYVVLKGMVI